MKKLIFNFKENTLDIACVSSVFSEIAIKSLTSLPYEFDNTSENKIASIKKVLKDINFRNKKADVLLSFEGIITRTIETPYMSKSDMASFIESNIKSYFTINSDEYYFDYKIVNIEKNTKKLFNILLVAAPKSRVDEIVRVLSSCNLIPEKIDVYPESIYKLFAEYNEDVIAVFDINKQKSNILIIDKGSIFLYSNINTEIEDRNFNELIENLGYFLNFYSSRHFGKKVDLIFTIGELAEDETLLFLIREQLNTEVAAGIDTKTIGISKKVDLPPFAGMEIIGQSLPFKNIFNKDINFWNALAEKKSTASMPQKQILIIAALSACCFTFFFIIGGYCYYAYMNHRYDTADLTAKLNSYTAVKQNIAEYGNEKALLEQKNNYMNVIKNDQFDYIGILEALQKGLPENVSIHSITLDKQTADITFNINKSTLDVARLTAALNEIRLFSHVEIENVSLDDKETSYTYKIKLAGSK